MLLEFPEVEYALSRIGRPEIGGDPEPVNNIEIYIGLKPVSEWTSASSRQELQHLMEQKRAEAGATSRAAVQLLPTHCDPGG